MAASKSSGGTSSEAPAQTAPRERAKGLRRLIARAGECKDLASLQPAHLRNDMCRGAKAVQADPSASLRPQPASASRINPAHSNGADATGSGNASIEIAKAASATT